jgi:hypothetical protein
MEQLLAMNVAAILTQAACGTSGGHNAVSPDLSDPQVRAKNLQAWETFRAYYQAVQALNDPQDWPVPNIPIGSFLQNAVQSVAPAMPGLVTALAPLVSATGPLGGIAGSVLALLSKATEAPAKPSLPSNIPSPGAKPAAPAKA